MNRIEACFRRLKAARRKALLVYLTAGYPDLETTVRLVPELAAAGADIIELGVPFSAPVADGVTIQRANCAALAGGVNLPLIIEATARIREKSQVPIALMGYYNPFLALGPEKALADCSAAGVDALIIPDLPPGESSAFRAGCLRLGMGLVYLLAPNSPDDRVRLVARLSTPFIYCVSVTGTTGARQTLPTDLAGRAAAIRNLTGKPLCLGFGISTPAQAAAFSRHFDGVIVGSALVGTMEKAGAAGASRAAAGFVRSLSQSIKRGDSHG